MTTDYWVGYSDVLTCRMTFGKTDSTRVIFDSVLSCQWENRTKALDSASLTPIALITCEGSNEPAEQAEPLEAQIPSMSKAAIRAILSQPVTVKEIVFERKLDEEPLKVAPSME